MNDISARVTWPVRSNLAGITVPVFEPHPKLHAPTYLPLVTSVRGVIRLLSPIRSHSFAFVSFASYPTAWLSHNS